MKKDLAQSEMQLIRLENIPKEIHLEELSDEELLSVLEQYGHVIALTQADIQLVMEQAEASGLVSTC